MGAETIDESRDTPVVFRADYRRIMSGAVSKAMAQANTPMDGGWGFDGSITSDGYEASRPEEASGHELTPEERKAS